MNKTKISRNSRTGRFVVKSAGKSKSGDEKWVIANKRGVTEQETATSAASATAMDRIVKKHSKALKRLADR